MYHVSAQGVDERMINVHYYYYYSYEFDTSIVSWVKRGHFYNDVVMIIIMWTYNFQFCAFDTVQPPYSVTGQRHGGTKLKSRAVTFTTRPWPRPLLRLTGVTRLWVCEVGQPTAPSHSFNKFVSPVSQHRRRVVPTVVVMALSVYRPVHCSSSVVVCIWIVYGTPSCFMLVLQGWFY